MKKRFIIIVCIMILLGLSGIFLFYILKDSDSNSTDEENQETKESANIEFNEKEKHIVDLVYNKLNILDYFDQNNLEYFEVKSIWVLGYFKSSSNIFHLQINYDYQCKDGTQNCDNTDERAKYDEFIHAFRVKVDLNDSNYIEMVEKFATTIDSDWTSYSEDYNIIHFYDLYNI